jgi:hypothetical protein
MVANIRLGSKIQRGKLVNVAGASVAKKKKNLVFLQQNRPFSERFGIEFALEFKDFSGQRRDTKVGARSFRQLAALPARRSDNLMLYQVVILSTRRFIRLANLKMYLIWRSRCNSAVK